MKKRSLTPQEAEMTAAIVRPVVQQIRKHLIRALRTEKGILREQFAQFGSKRFSRDFKQGVAAGMFHAEATVYRLLRDDNFHARSLGRQS